MRPAERREQERRTALRGGDARVLFLAAVSPAERSEAAARYDHQIEADHLAGTPFTDDELSRSRTELRQQAVIDAAIEQYGDVNLGYRDGLARILSGRIPPGSGLDRRITACRAVAAEPTEEQVVADARLQRQRRLDYLLARYGVSPRVVSNA